LKSGKRNVRFDQRSAHLFSALGHEKFAAPRKEKEQTDSDARQENAEPF